MHAALLRQQLAAFLSPAELPDDDAPFLLDQRKRYTSTDCVVVQPASVENVQKTVRFCAQHRIAITPQGGNTGLGGGSVAHGGIVLNLGKLNRIRHISLADNAITVDAGCILQNVQTAAAEHGRFFPLSLASEGTLGIITGATLKLFAPPQTTETAWVGLDNVQAAISLLSNIKNHFAERLCSFELVSRFALQLSAAHSRLAEPLNAEWHILLELTDSLPLHDLQNELAEFLCQNGGEHSIIAQSEQQRRDLWTLRENISAAQRSLGISIKHDIAVPIARTAEFIEQCGRNLTEQHPDIQLVVFGHLGDGSLHYNTFFPNELGDSVYRREEAVNATVYRHVLHNHGTIAAEHGIGTLKKSWLPQVRTADEIALMRAIKSQLDPNHLFNPNKLLPD